MKKLIFNFEINMSVNKMYYSNPYKKGYKFLTRDAKILRAKIMEETINQLDGKEFRRGDLLEVTVAIHEDWYTSQGDIRKKDIDNRLKFILDSIFKAYDLDDSQIFKLVAIKKQDCIEKKTVVIIEKIWN